MISSNNLFWNLRIFRVSEVEFDPHSCISHARFIDEPSENSNTKSSMTL